MYKCNIEEMPCAANLNKHIRINCILFLVINYILYVRMSTTYPL